MVENKSIILSDKEHRLIDKLREVKYVQVVVYMIGGKPDRIEVIRESIKL